MINLITTDSYFNLFEILVQKVKEKGNTLSQSNLVFCEAKISLMAERKLTYALNGSFNTDVYSFGKFLRAKMPMDNVLSKEGSAMALKKILSEVQLKRFKSSRQNLAPSLFDLIIQLKSAKVTPEDVLRASNVVSGVLKNKLIDIATVFSAYEEYVVKEGFEDQSSSLSYLPQIIENDERVKKSDVFIVGFNGFTAQMRAIVEAFINNARSVTAILTKGDNGFVFVNETAQFILDYCKDNNLPCLENHIQSDYSYLGKKIVDGLFNPFSKPIDDQFKLAKQEKVFFEGFASPEEEILRIAQVIKRAVINGECRYRDITLSIPDIPTYENAIQNAFSTLGVPYYLDSQKRVDCNPLITLILSYAQSFIKGFERKTLSAFYKNPLFTADKDLADDFENYIVKYNVNYKKIFEPFTFVEDGVDIVRLEGFRQDLVKFFTRFNVNNMLDSLGVEQKIADSASCLKEIGEIEESAVNEQIYAHVKRIIGEIEMMLGANLPAVEFKSVFISGVNALKLSIIPQYNDAVFISGHKECALAKAKYAFMAGLTSAVPNVKADVALLSDGDINALEDIKVLVEPKIRVVNHRTRENLAMALSAFSHRLYLSYPMASVDGKKNVKSEVISEIEFLIGKMQTFPEEDEYITKTQGLKNFATAVNKFSECSCDDFSVASAYHQIIGEKELSPYVEKAGKEVKIRLEGGGSVSKSYLSPTAIEKYYECPYRAFLTNVLKVKDNEDGGVNALSIGNFMHDVLRKYVENVDKVKDEESSNALFEEFSKKTLSKDEYKKFLTDPETAFSIEYVSNECKRFCHKVYLELKDTNYKKSYTEASFGDNEWDTFKAIPLLEGKTKIHGKIDRVDKSENGYRIIDYKTGKSLTKKEVERGLFSGEKLQLFLYALAVKNFDENKKMNELCYMYVDEKYVNKKDYAGDKIKKVGVDNKEEGILDSQMKYALAMCEQAVKQIEEGVIIPSPISERACEYCKFSSFCNVKEEEIRKIGEIDNSNFLNFDKGEVGDGVNN